MHELHRRWRRQSMTVGLSTRTGGGGSTRPRGAATTALTDLYQLHHIANPLRACRLDNLLFSGTYGEIWIKPGHEPTQGQPPALWGDPVSEPCQPAACPEPSREWPQCLHRWWVIGTDPTEQMVFFASSFQEWNP